MAPPPYAALGKQAKDIFGKGYHFGLWKLDCKTTTSSGIEFTTSGQSVQQSGKVSGSLETKYHVKDYGLSFTEKWNTNNTLNTEILLKDLVKGLKLSFEGLFAPKTDTKSGKIKVGYGQDIFQIDGDINIDLNGPLINCAAVIGIEGWLAGYQTAFDTQESKITTNNFAVGYQCPQYVVHVNINKGDELNGSLFCKLTKNIDGALQLSWSSNEEKETTYGVGATYKLDMEAQASLRAKINNVGQLGLGYQQKLRDGITLSLSTLIDGKNINDGVHKIGLALELEA